MVVSLVFHSKSFHNFGPLTEMLHSTKVFLATYGNNNLFMETRLLLRVLFGVGKRVNMFFKYSGASPKRHL